MSVPNTSTYPSPPPVKLPSYPGSLATQAQGRPERSHWYAKRKCLFPLVATLILCVAIVAIVPALVLTSKQSNGSGGDSSQQSQQHAPSSQTSSTGSRGGAFTGTTANSAVIPTSTDISTSDWPEVTHSIWSALPTTSVTSSVATEPSSSSSSRTSPASVTGSSTPLPMPSTSINQSQNSPFTSTTLLCPASSNESLSSSLAPISGAVSSTIDSSHALTSTSVPDATTTHSATMSSSGASVDSHFFTSLITRFSKPTMDSESTLIESSGPESSGPESSFTSGRGQADPRFTTSTITIFSTPTTKEPSTIDSNSVTGTSYAWSSSLASLSVTETTLWPTSTTDLTGAAAPILPPLTNGEASTVVSVRLDSRDGNKSRCLSAYQDDMNHLVAWEEWHNGFKSPSYALMPKPRPATRAKKGTPIATALDKNGIGHVFYLNEADEVTHISESSLRLWVARPANFKARNATRIATTPFTSRDGTRALAVMWQAPDKELKLAFTDTSAGSGAWMVTSFAQALGSHNAYDYGDEGAMTLVDG